MPCFFLGGGATRNNVGFMSCTKKLQYVKLLGGKPIPVEVSVNRYKINTYHVGFGVIDNVIIFDNVAISDQLIFLVLAQNF